MFQSICIWNIGQNEWSVPEKMVKNCQKHLFWTQNGQKQGDRIFFRAWCHNKKCTECSNLLKYAKLAKTNEAFLRKWQITAKNPYFGDKTLNNLDTHFFFKNRASSLFYIWNRLTCCKKSEKSNDGKYENFCHRQTDRQTDGAGFIGPAGWLGGSKNHDSDLILHTKKYKDDFHVPRKPGDEVRGETKIKSST